MLVKESFPMWKVFSVNYHKIFWNLKEILKLKIKIRNTCIYSYKDLFLSMSNIAIVFFLKKFICIFLKRRAYVYHHIKKWFFKYNVYRISLIIFAIMVIVKTKFYIFNLRSIMLQDQTMIEGIVIHWDVRITWSIILINNFSV